MLNSMLFRLETENHKKTIIWWQNIITGIWDDWKFELTLFDIPLTCHHKQQLRGRSSWVVKTNYIMKSFSTLLAQFSSWVDVLHNKPKEKNRYITDIIIIKKYIQFTKKVLIKINRWWVISKPDNLQLSKWMSGHDQPWSQWLPPTTPSLL